MLTTSQEKPAAAEEVYDDDDDDDDDDDMVLLEDTTTYHEDDDDDDDNDALSFCDLPIYYGGDDAENESDHQCASSTWMNPSSSISSSTDYNDDDCFEFSFSSSSQTHPEKNIIIFCGKIIPPAPKEEPLPEKKKTCHARNNISTAAGNYNKTLSSSSKWYMLMFGLVRIQEGKMELKDIKKRQSKRSQGDIIIVKKKNNRIKRQGIWSFLRTNFGCTTTIHLGSPVAR